MANNRLSAALAAALLVGCCSVGAAAEVASSDSVAESAVSAASEPVQQETAAPPDLSDTALSADTRYSVDEITEILKQHPNAFTTAADPAAASSAADHADQTAEDSTQTVTDHAQTVTDHAQTVADSGTIWLKPFNSYTPAEGYLLLLTVIALSGAAIKLIKYLWL